MLAADLKELISTIPDDAEVEVEVLKYELNKSNEWEEVGYTWFDISPDLNHFSKEFEEGGAHKFYLLQLSEERGDG